MNELYGGRPRPPVGGEVYWLRSVPVGCGCAGREGHVWPWNPTSPRRRAFHSSIPSFSPLTLSSTYPNSRLRVLLLLSCCCLFHLTLPRSKSLAMNSLSSICICFSIFRVSDRYLDVSSRSSYNRSAYNR